MKYLLQCCGKPIHFGLFQIVKSNSNRQHTYKPATILQNPLQKTTTKNRYKKPLAKPVANSETQPCPLLLLLLKNIFYFTQIPMHYLYYKPDLFIRFYKTNSIMKVTPADFSSGRASLSGLTGLAASTDGGCWAGCRWAPFWASVDSMTQGIQVRTGYTVLSASGAAHHHCISLEKVISPLRGDLPINVVIIWGHWTQ